MTENTSLSSENPQAHDDGSKQIIDVFSFYVGSALYSTRIENVLSLSQGTQTVRPMPGYPDLVLGVVDYQGYIVPLFDLSQLLETEADYVQWEHLLITLAQRKQDHIDWMIALEHSIRSGDDFVKARDPHACAFGAWYDKFETNDEDLKGLLEKFNAPHKSIHLLADSLLELSAKGEHNLALEKLSDERETTFLTLLSLFDKAQNHIAKLARTVILYTTIDGKTPAFSLKISEVNTAHTYNRDQLSHEKYGTGSEEDQIIEGFLRDDEGAISILLDMSKLQTVVEDSINAKAS